MRKRGYELINTNNKEENKTYGTPLIQIVKRTNHMTEITYNDKEEMNHYMECRLGDICNRCKNFMGEIVGITFADTVIDMNMEELKN